MIFTVAKLCRYLLPSDIGLLYDADLHKQVEKFAFDEAAFFAAFSRVSWQVAVLGGFCSASLNSCEHDWEHARRRFAGEL